MAAGNFFLFLYISIKFLLLVAIIYIMGTITYIPPSKSTSDKSIEIDNNIIDKDIDDVDYSKYAVDDSDSDMAEIFDY